MVQENAILDTKQINKLLKDTIRWTNQNLRQFNSGKGGGHLLIRFKCHS